MKFLLPLVLVFVFTACTSSEESKVIEPRTHAEWIELHNARFADDPCSDEFPEGIPEDMKVEAFDIEENQTLFRVLCSLHAYQNSYVFYTQYTDAPDGVAMDPINLPFETLIAGEPFTHEWVVEPEFDMENKTIVSRAKGRGIGDCGAIATYEWRSEKGGFFELTEFREKAVCDGNIDDEWPVIYQKEA